MASFILPTICRIGILSQSNTTTALAATKIFSSLDADVTGVFVQAHTTNAQPMFIGSSSVDTGASRGIRLAAGDDFSSAVAGPGADQFFQVSTVNTDNFMFMQVG